MDSPESAPSINEADDVRTTTGNGAINEHYIVPQLKGIRKFSRKSRKATKSSLQPFQGWENPDRRPYHQYVHELVQAGWDNLEILDKYMQTDWEDQQLVISVLDITDEFQQKRWPDIHDGLVLKNFLSEQNRAGVKVRLYMAEQQGDMAAGVMNAFGSSLDLDPRFFQWTLRGVKHVLTPSEHHRASYLSIKFGVPRLSTPSKTDAEKFKVTVYIKPDDVGDGWTGWSRFLTDCLYFAAMLYL